ncbi:hypothetical protein [Paractinoplanes rishiriensis]|uniref:Uncharacterized protein n=1 Tax=Paractinoplanes rishiriensis TaxID=1050105 RepID=A0A919MX06_9ACTN|nr:hypothetical protein [Actinoplanes rishiriensis]GIE98393.1 hypothetical protein Ari01nite_58580 [Actinoplanes rishiriensis]
MSIYPLTYPGWSWTGLLSGALRKQRAASVLEATRVLALGMDTATGRFRPNEAETAVRIEVTLGVRLTRAPRWSRADWFDERGISYDAVGPFAAGRFDQQWRRFSEQIVLHLNKAELVPVDVTLFTPAQVEVVATFIAERRLAPRVFILGR